MQSDRRAVASGALERSRYTGMAHALTTIVRCAPCRAPDVGATRRKLSQQTHRAAGNGYGDSACPASDPSVSTLVRACNPHVSHARSEEGLRGLWQGTLPAVQRAALVNLGELAAYDTAKQLALDSGTERVRAAGSLASFPPV